MYTVIGFADYYGYMDDGSMYQYHLILIARNNFAHCGYKCDVADYPLSQIFNNYSIIIYHYVILRIINVAGVSMLDISTRLRIAEAELAIVRNEVSELVAEKNTLEMQSKKHENSWKFALLQLGRTIEERNEALARLPSLLPINRDSKSPEVM